MEPDDNTEISESEKKTRFVCGALLGAILGSVLIYSFELSAVGLRVAVIVVAILLCGILALRNGDDFWFSIKDWL